MGAPLDERFKGSRVQSSGLGWTAQFIADAFSLHDLALPLLKEIQPPLFFIHLF